MRQAVLLRDGAVVADPLEVALRFVEAYGADGEDPSPWSFGEDDLRRANRGGARISAAEQAAVLARRPRIEAALREIPVGASLAVATVPWAALTELFGSFGELRGVGFSKMTKALHDKRPALIPILDSVVQAYLVSEPAPLGFAERATALVRSFKQDLDRNRGALRAAQRALAERAYALTEVRILDVLIWSTYA